MNTLRETILDCNTDIFKFCRMEASTKKKKKSHLKEGTDQSYQLSGKLSAPADI